MNKMQKSKVEDGVLLEALDGNAKGVHADGIVLSLVKAIKILRCFDEKNSEWGLAQLSQKLKMPKSTLLNLIRTLELGGYLVKVPNTQNYRLGMELFELGYVAKSAIPIIQYAIPIMEDIQEKTGEIVYFTVPRNGKVLYLEGVYPGKKLIHYSISGRVLYMHCTAVGKAMLAYLPDETVQKIINYWGMPIFTPQTISNYPDLMAALEVSRQKGYAIDIEEESPGVKCLAVPIRTSHNEVLGALSISGSVISMSDSKLPLYAEMLMSASNILAQKANLFPTPSFLPVT
jgi:DNA-binding IclR family transcriptional regulator